MTDSDRPRGILSTDDRAYLAGEKEFDHRSSESHARARIRERVFHSLCDGDLLLTNLPADQRRRIFEAEELAADLAHHDSDSDSLSKEKYDATESLGQMIFRGRVQSLLAFLYIGITESSHMELEDTLKTAITRGEQRRGRAVQEVTFNVETHEEDLEELRSHFEAGAPLGPEELKHLREETDIDGEDIAAYFDRLGE
jgi:hypothetical protein